MNIPINIRQMTNDEPLSACDPNYSAQRVRELLESAESILKQIEIGDQSRLEFCALIDSYRRMRQGAERLEHLTVQSWAECCDEVEAEWNHFLQTAEPSLRELELVA